MTPTRLLLWLALLWSALSLAAALQPDAALDLWWGVGAVLGVWLLLDLALARGRAATQVTRQLPASIALGAPTRGALEVINASGRARTLWVGESQPSFFEVEHLPRKVTVPAAGSAELGYTVRTTQRGEFTFGALVHRLRSPLGLWWRTVRGDEPQSVRVYPNFRAVTRYALLATSNRTSELGIRQRQRRGEGTEFHQLREYRVGDPLRQIDWRATSRRMKVISREYRDERDQQVLFMLDCGRRMHARYGELTHLDHALDAVLLLSYVALRQGDAVGLQTFGGQERQLPPRKGTTYLSAMLNAVFDLESTTSASDTAGAVEAAIRTLKKRSLIVIVTNLRDEEDAELMAALRVAGRRHLVLLVSLREVILDRTLEQMPLDFDAAIRVAATHDYLRARAEAHEKLGRTGLLNLDVQPRELAASLVNQYLKIKASGAL